MSEHQFRNTMFGGFNRQDVLDYLTGAAEKNNQELARQRENSEALERDLAAAREESARLRAELSEVKEERDDLRRQTEQLTAELARVNGSDKAKGEEVERLTLELKDTAAELARLQALVSKIAPDAEAYAAVKDRTAGMELEAHRRAQSVEARAKIMAGDLQRQVEQWIGGVEQQYVGLKTEVDSSVEQASLRLEEAAAALSRMHDLLEQQHEAIRRVASGYADSAPGKKAE